MSSQSIVNWTGNQKIYDSLLPDPYPYPAQANDLAQVLIAGQDAGNQDITNLNELQVTNITQQTPIGGHISLGAAGNTLRVLGATAKGSLLVGDGTDTKELVVGANGLVLTTNSTAPYGVEWAVGGGGGGVASVSAGTNISVTGTAVNPIVNLQAPLTSTLNMGSQSITDSAASTGTASQYLTAGTGGQTLWATLPSSVASVSAGTNITLTGTSTNPIVNLSAPLTSTLNVGNQTISSSTGAITIQPVAGQDINALVDGTGRLHITQSGTGGATQPAISVENNNGNANGVEIDFYKNSNSPAAADELGIVSFHGNSSTGVKTEYASIRATIVDPTNASQNGSLALSCCVNSATPSAFLTCDGTGAVGYIQTNKSINTLGNNITTTTGSVNLYQNQPGQNIGLTNVAGGGSILINKTNTGGSISITSSTSIAHTSSTETTFATGTGVYINQSATTSPKLLTDIANVIYYPTFVVDNQNLPNVSIPPPAIQGQRLTLINKGITPTTTWNDITAYSLGSGANTTALSSNGLLWIARVGSNVLEIYDQSFTLQGQVNLGGTGTQEVYCLLEDSGYMYIGGSFSSINSNATPQVSIARVSIYAPFTEDLIYDGMGTIFGVQYGGSVYDIESYGGYIYFGGNFITFSDGMTPAYNIMNISNVGAGTTIFDWCNGGVDNKVYTLLGAGAYLFVGGEFGNVAYGTAPVSYQYLATYTGGSGGSWDYTGGNAWNNKINVLQYTNTGYIFVGGEFNNTPQSYSCYIDYNAPQSSATASNLTLGLPLTRFSTFYNGSTYVSTQTNGVYSSSSLQVWVSEGTPQSGYTPSYIGYWNGIGKYVVAYTNYQYFMERNSVSQSASFTLTGGQFKFNASTFTSATISLRDVGWDFIGDLTSSPYTWRQTSYNPWGSYS